MRSVIYSEDFEPITVIELPFEVHDFKFPTYYVPVPRNLYARLATDKVDLGFDVVEIKVERLIWKGVEKPVFVTPNEEFALQLTSTTLPGQIKDYREQYKKGFMQAFVKILGA